MFSEDRLVFLLGGDLPVTFNGADFTTFNILRDITRWV
jgi:hypothetical protein